MKIGCNALGALTGLLTLLGSATLSHAQSEALRFPAITPLTGALAILGQDAKRGIDIAVEQINAGGGIAGRRLEIEVTDTQGKPDVVRRELERIVRLDNAPLILGCEISAGTSSAAQYAEQARVPYLNTAAVLSDVLERGYKWYFSQQITGDDEAATALAVMSHLAGAEKLSGEGIAILFEDSPRGAGTAERLKKLLQSNNVAIAAFVSYNRANRALLPVMSKVAESKAKLLVWAGYTEDVVAGLQAIKQLEYYPYVLGIGGGLGDPRLPELVEPTLLEKLKVANVDYFNPDMERARSLADAYRAKFKTEPSSYVSLGYSAVMALKHVVGQALKKSEKPTRADFRDILRAIEIPGEETVTPSSVVRFNAQGRNTGAQALVAQWQDGGKHKVTVWPQAVAKASPIPFR